MRVAQYRIHNLILNNLTIPDYIYAFERNKSIPEMAGLHTNKEVVLSVDIKDFFTSIKQKKVQEVLQGLGIGEKPALTLSEICTYKSFVPQGALTSPKVANIITALTFGPIIKRFCDQYPHLTMTIYADDVTVSSSDPQANIGEILGAISTAISESGFRVNRAKTKVMWKGRRQYVCGVVVNKKTNMLKKDRYRLRAIVHNITKNGLESEAAKSGIDLGSFAKHIKGKINWLKQLNPIHGDKLNNKLNAYLSTLVTEPIVTVSSQEQQQVQGDAPVAEAETETSTTETKAEAPF